MKKRYYLAYGSNLNIRQMRVRCPDARVIGTAIIPDYELLFKGSRTGSYLTIEAKDGSFVPVGVWEVTAGDEERLDVYEGFPVFYYRAEMKLPVREMRSGRIEEQNCFVYIMRENRPLGLPSRRYIETCREGYQNFGFDPAVLWKAYTETKNRIKPC